MPKFLRTTCTCSHQSTKAAARQLTCVSLSSSGHGQGNTEEWQSNGKTVSIPAFALSRPRTHEVFLQPRFHPRPSYLCRPVHPHQSSSLSSVRWSSTFVSRYQPLNIKSDDVVRLLPRDVAKYRETRTHFILEECPFCSKPTNGKSDNLYKCYIHRSSGQYFCQRCGQGGSWYDFVRRLRPTWSMGNYQGPASTTYPESLARGRPGSFSSSPQQEHQESRQPMPIPHKREVAIYSSNLLHNSSSDRRVLEYLTKTRGLNISTLTVYGVGRMKHKFPSKNKNKWVESDWYVSMDTKTRKPMQTLLKILTGDCCLLLSFFCLLKMILVSPFHGSCPREM